jgi:hypothetical protein
METALPYMLKLRRGPSRSIEVLALSWGVQPFPTGMSSYLTSIATQSWKERHPGYWSYRWTDLPRFRNSTTPWNQCHPGFCAATCELACDQSTGAIPDSQVGSHEEFIMLDLNHIAVLKSFDREFDDGIRFSKFLHRHQVDRRRACLHRTGPCIFQ